MLFLLAYMVVNLCYTVAGRPPYQVLDWKSFKGFIIVFAYCGLSNIVFFLLDCLTLKKLKSYNPNTKLVVLLSKKMYDPIGNYRFSETSGGFDSSISNSEKKVVIKKADDDDHN